MAFSLFDQSFLMGSTTILSNLTELINGRKIMFESELFSYSGSTAFRQLNPPMHKKGYRSFFFLCKCFISRGYSQFCLKFHLLVATSERSMVRKLFMLTLAKMIR